MILLVKIERMNRKNVGQASCLFAHARPEVEVDDE